MQAPNTQPLPRLTLKNMHVMIDRKVHPIVNMNIQDVLIGSMPTEMRRLYGSPRRRDRR
jgi:hypothetical protein